MKNKAIEALDYMKKYESKDFDNVVKELKEIETIWRNYSQFKTIWQWIKMDKSLKTENLMHIELNRYFCANYSYRKRHTKRL